MTYRRFQLGPWTVEPALSRILRDESVVALEPKVMRVLVCLAEHGAVVTRAELIAEVWDGLNVVDSAVNRAIYQLRRALGADEQGRPYVETIRQVGYRLTVPAQYVQSTGSRSLANEPFRARDLALVFMAAVLVGGAQLNQLILDPLTLPSEPSAIVAEEPIAPPPRPGGNLRAERLQHRAEIAAERRAHLDALVAGRQASRAMMRAERIADRHTQQFVSSGAPPAPAAPPPPLAPPAPEAPPAPLPA